MPLPNCSKMRVVTPIACRSTWSFRVAAASASWRPKRIVGADASDDRKILTTSASLYAGYKLRRVYYSAFSPTPHPSSKLPPRPPPLRREHRLYQADWLLRFYGFEIDEILAGGREGMLDLDVDPKLAWALNHPERFPMDINRATRDELLRVPGLGTRTFIVTRDWRPTRALESAHLRAQLVRPPEQGDLFA